MQTLLARPCMHAAQRLHAAPRLCAPALLVWGAMGLRFLLNVEIASHQLHAYGPSMRNPPTTGPCLHHNQHQIHMVMCMAMVTDADAVTFTFPAMCASAVGLGCGGAVAAAGTP